MPGYKSEQKMKKSKFCFFQHFSIIFTLLPRLHLGRPLPLIPRVTEHLWWKFNSKPIGKSFFRMSKRHKTHPKHVRTQIWTKNKISFFSFFPTFFHDFSSFFHHFSLISPHSSPKSLLTKVTVDKVVALPKNQRISELRRSWLGSRV